MANYTNFYETLKEALMRLRGTVVLYDGEPYEVFCIAAHKPDGIFRVYLFPIGWDNPPKKPDMGYVGSYEAAGVGPYLDEWMKANPESGMLRKMMNSPLFNKFRPYPLGMCNLKGRGAFYIERQPARKTEQGLTGSMLVETAVTASMDDFDPTGKKRAGLYHISIFGPAFKSCVLGEYPSAHECLTNLNDPKIVNNSAAFHRKFALVRGPIGMLFLAYKQEVVGLLTNGNFSNLRLGREFQHTREVIEELNLFSAIQ